MEEVSEEQLSESSTKVDCGSYPFAAVFLLMLWLIGDTAEVNDSRKIRQIFCFFCFITLFVAATISSVFAIDIYDIVLWLPWHRVSDRQQNPFTLNFYF